jgi:2-dehydropantoate 2-reductase
VIFLPFIQLSGGMREESGRIICIRGGGQMVLGSLDREFSFKSTVDHAFKEAKYKLSYNENMDAWIKSHIVPIVAMNSIHYLKIILTYYNDYYIC